MSAWISPPRAVVRNIAATACAATCLLGAAAAFAAGWHFTPTPREWETWPQFCRVEYSYIDRGENAYGDYYPDSEIAAWRDRIGEKTFISLHHYCAAMLYLKRLKLERRPDYRAVLLSNAVADGEYTYERTDPQSIVYPAVASVMAQAKYVNGARDDAISILQRAIAAQPDRFEAYGTLAEIYREEHKLDKAVEVVNQANTATGGESAEIQYNLGLINLEAGHVDAAVENAKRAYELGYPLPGLRNKLQKLGRWQEPSKPQ
jgi:tetratricopeptide (TPR) repeat protein